ncbi:MAG TPA: hypothetical protein VGZ25_06460, partial [Gemmataceae bacterium]|nr:hypothetical protein [Gemmataceae bacterium]
KAASWLSLPTWDKRTIADDPNFEGGQAVGSLGPTLAVFERPCTNRNESCRKNMKDNVAACLRQSSAT